MLLSEEWISGSSNLTLYHNLVTGNERILDLIFWCGSNPVWWGSVPALMMGFTIWVFLHGFSFKKRANSVWWNRYLICISERPICTMDMPSRFYRLRYGSPGHKAMKQMPLQYVEIKNVKITSIGPKRLPKEPYRDKWLVKILNDPLKKTFLMAPAQYPPVHRVPG